MSFMCSRWERENNPLLVARAHAAGAQRAGLVMLGHAIYDDELEREVRAAAAPNCRAARVGLRAGVHRAAEQCPMLHPCDRGRRDASGADRGDGGRQPLPRARHPGESRGRRTGCVVLRRTRLRWLTCSRRSTIWTQIGSAAAASCQPAQRAAELFSWSTRRRDVSSAADGTGLARSLRVKRRHLCADAHNVTQRRGHGAAPVPS